MEIALIVRHLRLRLGLLLALLAGAVGPGLAQAPPNLNRVEFFFDTDPGHGLATAVALPGPAAPTRLGLTFPVPLGSLAPGFHRLFIRTRDADGGWSQTFGRLLFIDDASTLATPNLAEVEHFLDTDPGFGNGISTALSGTSKLGQTVAVNIGSLAPGFHRLFMRTRDVNNRWSQTFARLFFVDDNAAFTAPNLAEVEHFLDTDPGFGNGISTALSGTSKLGQAVPVNIGSLAPGFHRLFMRTRDVNNRWSQTFARLFFVDDVSTLVAPNLARAEFYFDTDPGFGSGTAIPTGAAATSYTNLPVVADATALADGPHRLFVRVRDANGRWSQVLNRRFVRSGCAASENFAEGRPSASYGGNLGAAVAEAVFNGSGEANFFNSNTVQADLGAATRTVSEAQASLRNPNGTAVSGTLTLEISLNGTTFTPAGAVPVSLAASQAAPQLVVLPLAAAVAGVRAVRLLLTLPSNPSQAIRMTDAGAFFFNCVSPVITSFAPTSGPAGTSVVITGTNLGGVTAVRFNGTVATVFSGVSATSVTATVPAGASTGPISLTTPNGTAVSSSNFAVTVPAPTITSFTPTSGPVGTSVMITGTDLGTTSAVRFNGITAPTFTVVNGTSVTATVPAGATTGVISVTTTGGAGSSAASFTVVPPPTVASFSPASGPVGTSVVVTGTDFTGATAVQFNGLSASGFVVNSATQITVAVPAGATTGPVRVTTAAGSGQSAASFTVTTPAAPAPTIASFTPGNGPVGTSVIITGTNFTGATALTFNGTAAPGFVVNSATQITVSVPTGATTGVIGVTTAGGSASSASSFTVTVPAPTISSFTPGSGPVGTSVNITGTNFTGATAVAFNGTAAPGFVVNSATQIAVSVPTGASTGFISLTTPGGSASSAGSFTVTTATLALIVTARNPTRHANTAAQAANVALTFNQALDAATAANVRVHSTQAGGRKAGAASASGAVLTFNPTTNFRPGEVVRVSVPATVLGAGGTAATPHVYEFTTAVSGGTGLFSKVATVGTSGGGGQVAQADVDGDGDLDLLAVESTGGTVQVRRNNGSGQTYAAMQYLTVGAGARTLTVADFDNDGDLDFATANTTANTVSVALNNGSGTFSIGTTLNVGSTPRSLTTGDVDGDGDLDLIIANDVSPGVVQVRLNNGSGTGFTSAPDVATAGFPIGPTLADVDHDGDLDLLVGSRLTAGTVSVRLNNGSGTFSGTGAVSVGSSPFDLALADLNGDGNLDLAAVNLGSNDLSVRLGDGTGAFGGGSTVSTGSGPSDVKAGDIDGDGDLDLLVTNNGAAGPSFSVCRNDGAGSFAVATTPCGASPQGLSLGDADGDGDLDFVLLEGGLLVVYHNQAAPTITAFAPASGGVGTSVTLTGTNFLGATTVRFNGTATTGLAVASATGLSVVVPPGATSGPISVTTNSGTGTSAGSFTLTASMTLTALAPSRNALASAPATNLGLTFDQPVNAATAANLRVLAPEAGGRRSGAASASGAVLTFNPTTDFRPGEVVRVSVPATIRGTNGATARPQVYQLTMAATGGSGTFTGTDAVPVGAGAIGVALADVNGDGNLDLLTANNSANSVSVRLGTGAGAFAGSGAEVPVGRGPRTMAVGDVDGDGDLDFVTANALDGTVSVARNAGAGTFPIVTEVGSGLSIIQVALGDVDGDGDLDLLATNLGENTLSIRFNDGGGAFSGLATVSMGSGSGPFGLALADMDNDGDLDAVATRSTTGGVAVRLNNGAGTFADPSGLGGGGGGSSGTRELALGDLDGDGDVDVVAVNASANTVSILLNNGGGVLSGGTVPCGANSRGVALADVDGDGDLDLLVLNRDDNTVSRRLNDDTGTFGAAQDLAIGNSGQVLATGDVDNDGDIDLVATNFVDATVSVRLNQPAPLGIVTGVVSPASYCQGQTLDVPFSATTAGFGAGNQFQIQLSDAAGVFAANAPLLGTLLSSDASGGIVRASIPAATPPGAGYRVRVVASMPATTGTPNAQNIAVTDASLLTWTGAAANSSWFDAGNWSCGQLPTSTSNVSIPAGMGTYPVLPATGPVPAARNLTINSGATLTLGNGFSLTGNLLNNGTLAAGSSVLTLAGTAAQTLGGSGNTVLFDLTVNNPAGATLRSSLAVRRLLTLPAGNLASAAFLTLRSDAGGTAMVVNPSGGGLVTGRATMERFINNATGTGYRHYSSPMQLGTTTVQEFADDLPVFNLNPAYNTTGTSATPFPTLFKYDETRLSSGLLDKFDRGWMVPLATDLLVPGRGYTAQTAPTTTVDLTGALSSADVNLTLSRGAFVSSGWHLLGNPFPSPLDWDLVPAAAGVNRALYVFVPNGPYSGTYRSYLPNATPGQPGIGTNGGTKDVAAMQGFFVRATADASALVLPTAARPSTYVNPVFARGSSGGLAPLVRLLLSNSAGQADEAVIHFDPAATADFTAAHDAYKVQLNGGGLPTLWSQAGPLALSINGLPSVRQTPSIPLGVRVGQTGAYTLSAPELLNLPAGTEIWLEDQALSQRHNLSLNPSYAFSMNASFTGQRFFLWFQQRVTATQSATLLANARVYPNPAVHTATVELAGVTGPVEVELTSVLGQTVRRFTAQPRAGLLRETLDLSNVATGVYLVRLRTATGQATLRLLRE
ncbi:FG-GAP-like repeat-containing protein [Hymenobacter sp. IS2118]|uniref:FG-GAP-like repeat-containing protein n=1 Tax=Hymenobacter sp. IS2118 TaxID=1505605 RepID=UPI000558AED7|nr:FG-GAP-like repeat-containing protein [Hymenobacter sp. IS2118]